MPALLAAPLFTTLLTAASAAAGLATTGYQLANQPGSPKAPTGPTPDQQAAAQKAREQAAILAQNPNTQAQTGGSLTPTSFTATSAKAAGVPSDLNSIMQSLGGSGSNAPVSGGTTTPNSGPSSETGSLQNLSDLLKAG